MLSPNDSPSRGQSTSNPLSHLVDSIFSYDGNVMLAALVSLLFVILFVLLLHVYAKWFLAHAHHRRRRSSMTFSSVLGPTRLHNFPNFTFDLTALSASSSKGLDPSIISTIPLFVYKSEDHSKHGLECVICLSGFEDDDIGRNLPKCGHAFHVECIDMWLGSHPNCPICRAPAVFDGKTASANSAGTDGNSAETMVAVESGLATGESSLMEAEIDVSGSGDAENVAMKDCVSPSSSSSFGCSLKRMLSRSKSENKVCPASSLNELGA
ncbi:hypothetical protein FNV43_RR05342 [Rhamnella rubrinervis]|uniref:RING-type E3 ubiquitin transferase n=1 Tax=Rhamnella rubrinervis TaxID=2594499 RepID=A0A8K0MR03_9ROSA|nr:hypothetical protein FNV43_RR05342 [Rhamnella rubrinervis]